MENDCNRKLDWMFFYGIETWAWSYQEKLILSFLDDDSKVRYCNEEI